MGRGKDAICKKIHAGKPDQDPRIAWILQEVPQHPASSTRPIPVCDRWLVVGATTTTTTTTTYYYYYYYYYYYDYYHTEPV